MTSEIIIAIISGIVAILVALIDKTELFSRKHKSLIKDIELYNSLPNSNGKKDLLDFIDQKVSEYIKTSKNHKRNGVEIVIGIIFLMIGAYLTWFFIKLGSWWLIGLIASIFIILMGLCGAVQGMKKVERDEKGNPVKRNKNDIPANRCL